MIFRSLFVIAAVAAIAGGATFAYFSDVDTVNNNTFSAGTLKISLKNPNGNLPFAITNWAPGKTSELRLDVKNDGSLNAIVKGAVSGKWDGLNHDKYVEIEKLKYWDGEDWKTVETEYLPVSAGQTLKIKASVKFSENAGNEYQGKTYRASFVVKATQPENTEWK